MLLPQLPTLTPVPPLLMNRFPLMSELVDDVLALNPFPPLVLISQSITEAPESALMA